MQKIKMSFEEKAALEHLEKITQEFDLHHLRLQQEYQKTKELIGDDLSALIALAKVQNERLREITSILKAKLDVVKVTLARIATKEAITMTSAGLPYEKIDAMDILNNSDDPAYLAKIIDKKSKNKKD